MSAGDVRRTTPATHCRECLEELWTWSERDGLCSVCREILADEDEPLERGDLEDQLETALAEADQLSGDAPVGARRNG